MISRYESEAMTAIWSDEARLERWVAVEMAVLSAQVSEGVLPDSAWKQAANCPTPTPEQVAERELETRHDVVAFLDVWGAEFAHLGLTSSDVVETAQSMALQRASIVLLRKTLELSHVCHQHTVKHWNTYRVGRTHGQRGTVDTWGHKMADFMYALDRNLVRLTGALEDISVAKLSGPTGTYADISRDVEIQAAKSLGLLTVPVASQILMRDSLVHWAHCITNVTSVCEAIATEIRLSAHSGVREVDETFAESQRGSSSMPHKRNPITAERICGLARLARGYASAIEPSIVQWHERDIAHSSVERVALVDLCHVADTILDDTTSLLNGLNVRTNSMYTNVRSNTDVYSHRVLAALMKAGVSRKDAHAYVHETARKALLGDLEREVRRTLPTAFPDTFVDFDDVFSMSASVDGLSDLGDTLRTALRDLI